MFNNKWNNKSAINNNAENTNKALNSMYFYPSKQNIPIALRTMLIRSVLLPIASYGGEIFGMSQARAAKLQTVIDEACRRVVHAIKSVALTRLREELRITHITGNKKWVSRFETAASYGSAGKVLEIRARAKDKSKISEWISKNDIGFSRNLTDLELLYPEHSSGIQKIIKIRIGCFNTALKLAKSRTLAEEYLNKCLFCNKFEPETVEHYLFKCSKWANQRQSILGEYISQPNLIVPGLTCSKLLAVKIVLSTAQFLTATYTTRAINFKELIVAPASWTQSRNGMETLVDYKKKKAYLFADNAVVFADNMQVNASKCGVMGVGDSTNMLFTLQHDVVPQVEKALHSMYYYLSSRKVPLVLRAMLISLVLLPMATYGGELFGMSIAQSTKLQKIIDNACRTVMGCGSSIALSRLCEELKIATVNTRTAVARKRAYYKWPTLNTWMPALMAALIKSQLST
ncbi:hypothetical protein BB561_003913 [Smittium simulii]|uniref:Uncharacterized protein n=1 Tax=Smittium simulii TaxID=133385 RepID=A0A2T9YJ52_9FUNG|nr:hypothetical protein BB561_003913 [Smittium simulii]